MGKKAIIWVSELDRNIFDDFFLMVAGGLGAFGIEDLFSLNWLDGSLKIAISYFIILLVAKHLRKLSDKKK